MLTTIIEQLVLGLFSACFIFLCSVGLSLVFGAGNIFNFAHGSFFMLGAYVCYAAVRAGFYPLWACALAAVATGVVATVIYLVILRRLPNANTNIGVQILATYAVLLIISDVVRAIWGGGFISVTLPWSGLHVWWSFLSAYQVIVIVATAALGIVLIAIMRFSGVGRLIRAASNDATLLEYLGVDPNLVAAGVFAFAGAVAGLGGALAVPLITITPFTGDEMIVSALIVTIVGGRGNLRGAAIAALVLSEAVALGNLFIPRLATAIPFIAALAVLAIRPSGLLDATMSDAGTIRA